MAGQRTTSAQRREGHPDLRLPRKKPTADSEADKNDPPVERVVRYFPTLSVFDITQTDPIDRAEPIPENPSRRLTGGDDHGMIAPLTAHLEASGWSIHRSPLTSANGYTEPATHRIMLAENLSVEHTAKTLLHEAAHIELHHIYDIEEYRAHRGRMDVEAESVAFIAAGLAGLNTSTAALATSPAGRGTI